MERRGFVCSINYASGMFLGVFLSEKEEGQKNRLTYEFSRQRVKVLG